MDYMGISDTIWEQYSSLTNELSKYRYGSEEFKEAAAKGTAFEREQILAGNKNFIDVNVIDPLCELAQAGFDDDYTKEILVDYIAWFKQNGFTQYVSEILKWASTEVREVLEQV